MKFKITNLQYWLNLAAGSWVHQEVVWGPEGNHAFLYAHGNFQLIVDTDTPTSNTGEVVLKFDAGTAVVCDDEFAACVLNSDVFKQLTHIDLRTGKPQSSQTDSNEAPKWTGRSVDSGFKPNPSKDKSVRPPKSTGAYAKGWPVFEELNAGCHWKDQREGFWREGFWRDGVDDDDDLPWPVALTCKGFRKDDFLRKLRHLESSLKPKVYRGMSLHRWTRESNGNAEYECRGWRWPSGYATYIADGVLPSTAFYKFVTGNTIAGLPNMHK